MPNHTDLKATAYLEPAIHKLKDVAGCINGFALRHLLAAAQKAQEQTDKPVGAAFVSSGETGKRVVQLDAFSNERIGEGATPAPASERYRPTADLTFEVEHFLPLLTYGHGNKVMLDQAVANIVERVTAGQGPTTGRTFRLPANFVNDRIYEQMGPGIILWLRIVIEQQRCRRKLNVRDADLAEWLGTSRATIAGYKRMLSEFGFLNIDTTTRPQVLSVSYFPRRVQVASSLPHYLLFSLLRFTAHICGYLRVKTRGN